MEIHLGYLSIFKPPVALRFYVVERWGGIILFLVLFLLMVLRYKCYKSVWILARQTSHSKIMGINMELVLPLLL
jgi:hypothetical protein